MIRLLTARGAIPAGTLAEHDSLCFTVGQYAHTYVKLADGSFLLVSPDEIEVVQE